MKPLIPEEKEIIAAVITCEAIQDIGQIPKEKLKIFNRLTKRGCLKKTREFWHGWCPRNKEMMGKIGCGPLKSTWRLAV